MDYGIFGRVSGTEIPKFPPKVDFGILVRSEADLRNFPGTFRGTRDHKKTKNEKETSDLKHIEK